MAIKTIMLSRDEVFSTHRVDVAYSVCCAPAGRADLNVSLHHVRRLRGQRRQDAGHDSTAEVHQRGVRRRRDLWENRSKKTSLIAPSIYRCTNFRLDVLLLSP